MSADLLLNEKDFEKSVLQSDVPVLIDFSAEWCGPCKQIARHIEELAHEYKDKAKVYTIDIDKSPNVAFNYHIMSIPALVVFKGGREVDRFVGATSKGKIAELIDRSL